MDDVWFGRGATRADLEACSEVLSLTDRSPPFFAVSGDEEQPRLILASRALFRPFGVASGEALSARLLDSEDPGSRRLGTINRTLPLDGAPRLERLRFFMGPGTEIITALCRRISHDRRALLLASVLSVPSSMGSTANSPLPGDPLQRHDTRRPEAGTRTPTAMNVQAIQAMLRTRWPASLAPRFTWQTDHELVCTQVSPMLADVVGLANADIVGRDMAQIAAMIDPTGRFAAALARRETWSGLEVGWPIADAPAAVMIGFGAIPMFGREKVFEGYRGYGVLHVDRIAPREPTSLGSVRPSEAEGRMPIANVVRFPGAGKTLSEEDRKTFVELGTELREEAGLNEASQLGTDSVAPGSPSSPSVRREKGIARHGLAILDRLAVGLLVARDNVPIFSNRNLLDRLGFADEDALHEAGGMSHLFDGRPDDLSETEPVGIRGNEGRIIPGKVRLQTIDWDGLPATLLTFLHSTDDDDEKPGRNETDLRELRAILETATDGVAVIDANYNVLSLNRSGEALFGCDRSAVIGRPFLSLLAPHNQGLAADYLEGLRSNATKRLLNDGREFLVNAHPGGTIPVFMTLGRLSGSSSSDEGGSGTRFCALFRDLTHWKKVERDLEVAKQDAERANDLKSDFLTKVSHEIRTPLNAIIGFAEVMMEERFGPVGSERYKDYLRDVHASGTHVMSLVNDLLDLSKIEAGKMELAVEVIDVNKVISECVAIMQPQASGSRIIMRLSLSPTLPRIKADERSLRQIVLNIVSNAVKFNEPGGQVIVATAMTEAGHAVIRIRDTGPGMSESDVAAALEPFRQLSTARPAVGGTGLGLPLTKALVEANQATFSIRSKIDHGTLVEVAFPPARVMAA